jgi:hypothetical protein
MPPQIGVHSRERGLPGIVQSEAFHMPPPSKESVRLGQMDGNPLAKRFQGILRVFFKQISSFRPERVPVRTESG